MKISISQIKRLIRDKSFIDSLPLKHKLKYYEIEFQSEDCDCFKDFCEELTTECKKEIVEFIKKEPHA